MNITVVGSGIAGKLAALVCADQGHSVFLLEKEQSKPDYSDRKLSQSHHAHLLLQRGIETMDALVPGFRDQLISIGGVPTCGTSEWYTVFPKGQLAQFESDCHFVCASRSQYESALQVFIDGNDRVSLIHTKVEGVNFEGMRAVVNATGLPEQATNPDLLIDCRGRGTSLSNELQSAGFEAPKTMKTTTGLCYTSFYIEKTMVADKYVAGVVMPKPDLQTNGCVFMPGNDAILVTLTSQLVDTPTDKEGILEFAKNIPDPVVHQILSSTPWLTDPRRIRKTENSLTRYGLSKQWPINLIALGDSVVSFNPVYGQGMTVSSLQADSLSKSLSDFERLGSAKIQRKLTSKCYEAWLINLSEDLRWPTSKASIPSWVMKPNHAFLDKVFSVATRDKVVCKAIVDVLHIKRNVLALFAPDVLWRLLLK